MMHSFHEWLNSLHNTRLTVHKHRGYDGTEIQIGVFSRYHLYSAHVVGGQYQIKGEAMKLDDFVWLYGE